LVERIKRGDCVLVPGPRLAVRAKGPDHRPLDELPAFELSNLDLPEGPPCPSPVGRRRAEDSMKEDANTMPGVVAWNLLLIGKMPVGAR